MTPRLPNAPTVEVTLPPALTRLFPDAPARIELSAATVDCLLDALDQRWPGMRDRLADTTPAIRRHTTVFIDGRRARLDTPLSQGARVFVITAVSGG
jgi:sulfur-carrier protein